MGQAKRKKAWTAPRAQTARSTRRVQHTRPEPRREVINDSAVDQILDPSFEPDGGDTVAGIRNATLVGAVIWTLLALVLF